MTGREQDEHDPHQTSTFVEGSAGQLVTRDGQDAEPDEHPETIGRYKIASTLGRGGMGIVYAAFDPSLDRRVALKVLLRGNKLLNATPRMLREAKALAALSHPNVVAVFDVGTAAGRVFIAMEYIEGQPLRQWQREEARTWTDVVDAYQQAGRGLAAAHQLGLVHRDFKPDNAIVDGNGRVRVLDFGLAVHQGTTPVGTADPLTVHSRLTMTGTVLGTPAYMSPEQLRGSDTDPRDDQFAFCVALFEALYGQRPFRGRTIAELQDEIAADRQHDPTDRRGVPPWLHRAIVRGLAARADARWPSMTALLAHLDAAKRRRKNAVLASVALAGVAAVGLGAQSWLVSDDPEPCANAAARVDAAWNPDRREAVRTRLLGSAEPHAQQTWMKVDAGLSDYALRWGQAHQRVCEATETSASQANRLRCLQQNLSTLDALVSLLGHADRALVRDATKAVANLPDLQRCQDEAALAVDTVAPPLPEVAAEVIAIDQALAQVRARELAGLHEQGLVDALALVQRARATQYAPVLAQALYDTGKLYSLAGRYDHAETSHSEAAMLASQSGAYAIAAAAMSQLTVVVGNNLARPDEGIEWGRHAQAMLERAQLDDTEQAQLLSNVAASHFRGGDFATALEHYQRADELMTSQTGARATEARAVSHNNIGNTLAVMGRLTEAQTHQEAALALTTELRGPNHPGLAISLGNLANTYVHSGLAERAVPLQERALAIRQANLPPGHPHLAATHSNLGLALAAIGDHPRALIELERALTMTESAVGPDHVKLALILHSLGESQRATGQARTAIASHTRASRLWVEAYGDEHPFVGYPEANLGLDHFEVGELDRASALLERASALASARDDTELAWVADVGRAQVMAARQQDLPRAAAMAGAAADALQGTRYKTLRAKAQALHARLTDGASLGSP